MCRWDREKEKAQLTAEVQFLEAFSYANILKYMGGASLLDHPLELNEKLPSRSSEEETYNHIVGLLDKAAASCPISAATVTTENRVPEPATH